jgi:hypothetical protein
MRTIESKGVLVVALVLTLAAGLAGGLLGARYLSAPPVEMIHPSSPLDELQLTADQTQHMRKIWESVRDTTQTCLTRGQLLRQQRDKAMEALLTDEQKARFEKVNQDYEAQVLALNNQREQIFQNAVKETEQMLTERQRGLYDAILRKNTRREPGQPLLEPTGAAPAAIISH